MTEMTTSQTDKLIADLQTLIADAEDLMQAAGDDAADGMSAYRARLRARLAKTRVDMTRLQDSALARAKAASQAADAYVQHRPWQAVGVAAGLGLVIGTLISRR
ncbi:MAG: DUF883 family protein [Rubrivivax sp.]|nr:DUF883 family protein [Rubrivivax sp.]MDP3082426.1 DUF883 family protein [Rubrivivax sp.]